MLSITKSFVYRVALSTTLISSTLALPLFVPVTLVQAAEVTQSSRVEVQSPKLLRTIGSNLSPDAAATLYFTVYVPQSYRMPIEAIRISEIPSGNQQLSFDHARNRVVLGDRVAKNSTQIPLTSLGGSDVGESSTLLPLAEPIQPGRTVTIAVTTERNPLSGGIHQFGVTAYSTSGDDRGLYIGTGRVHFDERN